MHEFYHSNEDPGAHKVSKIRVHMEIMNVMIVETIYTRRPQITCPLPEMASKLSYATINFSREIFLQAVDRSFCSDHRTSMKSGTELKTKVNHGDL